MSTYTEAIGRSRAHRTPYPGVTTASMLTVLLVSTAVGTVSGITLGGILPAVLMATLAGLLGAIAAGVVRNTVLIRAWEAAGVEDAGTPLAVIVYAIVASLAGGLAAHQLISLAGPVWSGITGMVAGLLSGGLMGLLIAAHSQCCTD